MWIRTDNKCWNSDNFDNIYVELETVVFEKHLPVSVDNETVTFNQMIDMEDYYDVFHNVLPEYEYKYQRWMSKVAWKLFNAITDWIADGTMKKCFITESFVETLLRQCMNEEEKEYNEYSKDKSNS